MTYQLRPAVREQTPLIIGIAGPTKSGKTFSALRLAMGLANGGRVAMVNAEGPRGHQYADKFTYDAIDLAPPFRPMEYSAALTACAGASVVIIDSASHMHDGPGGILEWHEEILDRIAGNDYAKRQRSTFTAWVEPKAAETQFIYTMLSMKVPVVLCLRAKEKIKIVKGQEPIDLGWQPIAGERVAFETIFTLMLPPHSKGVPDLKISDMREPFDAMVPVGKPIDEALGRRLATWAKGAIPASRTSGAPDDRKKLVMAEIVKQLTGLPSNAARARVAQLTFGVATRVEIEALPLDALEGALAEYDGPSRLEQEILRWRDEHEKSA